MTGIRTLGEFKVTVNPKSAGECGGSMDAARFQLHPHVFVVASVQRHGTTPVSNATFVSSYTDLIFFRAAESRASVARV
jgi:hypothetical protein